MFCFDLSRQTVVRIFVATLLLCIGLVTLSRAQVAFIKHDSLYISNIGKNGLERPIRVCRVWPTRSGESTDVQWTSDGQLALVHNVDTYQHRRYGLTRNQDISSLWLVKPQANQQPVWVVQGNSIALCPDHNTVSYCTSSLDGDTWLFDIKSHTSRLVGHHWTNFIWSDDGKIVAFIALDRPQDFSQSVEIRTYPEMHLIRKLEPIVNPCDLKFSPDSKQLAIHYHLSRPLTGHTVVSVHGDSISLPKQPDQYAPAIINGWSPNGKWIACEWRTVDPNNDGSWNRCRIGLSSSDGTQCKELGLGFAPAYSKDGESILYLTDHRTGCRWNGNDLVMQSVRGGPIKTLATNVLAFAVRRNIALKKLQ